MTENEPPIGAVHATATFSDRPCGCCITHVPRPVEVELHHVWPAADQIGRFGEIVDPRLVPLCDIAHKNVHVAMRRIRRGETDFKLGNRYQMALVLEGLRLMEEGEAS